MADKMTVLFIKKTGHIVGALTRTADPASKPTAAALAGAGLLVRGPKPDPASRKTISFVVSPDSLDTAVVDFDPDVFGAPMGFAVNGSAGVIAKLGTKSILIPDPTLEISHVTVRLPSPPADPLGVWVQLEEAEPLPGNQPQRRVMAGTYGTEAPPNDFLALTLTIRPDGPPASIPPEVIFNALVLVAGHQPWIDVL